MCPQLYHIVKILSHKNEIMPKTNLCW